MRHARPVVLSALAGLVLCAPLALAAPTAKPQLTDPSGDAPAGAAFDIVSGQLTTTGITATKKVGRKVVKTYTPKNLVATLTLAGPPSSQPGASYAFDADMSACDGGYLSFSYTPGNTLNEGYLYVSGCGEEGSLGTVSESFDDVTPTVKGNSITWTMPLSHMGKDLPLTTRFTTLTAQTDLVDPVFGLGTNIAEIFTSIAGVHSSLDYAEADANWKLG